MTEPLSPDALAQIARLLEEATALDANLTALSKTIRVRGYQAVDPSEWFVAQKQGNWAVCKPNPDP